MAEEAKYPIGIPVETNAADAASEVESLRDSIAGGTDAIRAMSGTLRQLRGSTDEVKAAKARLKSQIDIAKDSVSASTLALVKQGTSYDAVAQKAKKNAAEQKKLADQMKNDEKAKAKQRTDALSAAVSKAGGPVASLRERLKSLTEVTGGAGGAMGLATLAAAGLVAGIVALAAAAVTGAVSLGRFILGAANAARSANLAREAWAGTSQNASNLGSQVDALSNKVATSKAALNDLAISLMKTKLGGQVTVDAFNAVGQASAALGDEAGNKLKDFIERGRLMGRMRIDPREMLEGFGTLNFSDITDELAKSTHKSVQQARAELMSGATKLGDGAAAMRAAVEKKFGELNARKMLDLNVIVKKFHESLEGLTKNVKLEPLLKAVGKFTSLFDESTVTGATLQKLVTVFGDGMVGAIEKGVPLVKTFMEGLIIGGLRAYNTFLDLEIAFKRTFGGSSAFKDIDLMRTALVGGEVVARLLGTALIGVVGAVALLAVAGAQLIKPWQDVIETFATAKKTLGEGWEATGRALVQGLIAGIKGEVDAVAKQMRGLVNVVKSAVTGKDGLDMHSPSKVFEQYGRDTSKGYAKGVAGSAPEAAEATRALGAPPSGGRAAGAPITVNVTINASGGGGGGSTAKDLSDPSFMGKLTKAIEDALSNAGIPVLS